MRHVLLIEENEETASLAKDALSHGRGMNTLHHVTDAIEAIKFLRRENDHTDAPRPHLILMNVTMPDSAEHSTLKEIKQDPALQTIPVAVLTNSDRDSDVWETYQRHANCYLVKPELPDQYKTMISSVGDFWLSVAVLPPSEDHPY